MDILKQLFRMAEFCMTVRSTQLLSMAILSTNISQGSVVTHLRGVGYLARSRRGPLRRSTMTAFDSVSSHIGWGALAVVTDLVQPSFRKTTGTTLPRTIRGYFIIALSQIYTACEIILQIDQHLAKVEAKI